MAIILTILIPFVTAIGGLFLWQRREVQRWLSIVGSAVGLVAAVNLLFTVQRQGIQVLEVGNWPAPFGIVFVVDLLSAIMVMITAVMGLIVGVYALADIDTLREAYGYHVLYPILIMGVTGSFVTGDIFNLFVWFEIMLIASFVLMALGGQRPQFEGALKYLTLNLISSAIFLSAVGLLYGVIGTLNMADVAHRMDGVGAAEPTIVNAIAFMFLLAFGIKSAVFPLFGWLPASYHTPPTAVTTIFGALLTKVGVYAILRVFTLIFVQPEYFPAVQTVILILAGCTMVTGVLGAVAQYDVRRLLSFHIISQIGYLIMGIGIHTTLALAGTVFFMVHVILAKSALFLISGVANELMGTYYLKRAGGLYEGAVSVAIAFFVPAMALAGIPPLSGFWAKFSLIRAGLEAGHYWIVATGLAVSVLTLYSMTKIWAYAYWNERPPDLADQPLRRPVGAQFWLRLGPAAVLGGLTVLMGLFAGPLFDLALQTAEQLLQRQHYISAVLGG